MEQPSESTLGTASDEAEKIGEYWERRFAQEGLIWSAEPSPTAQAAADWFERFNVRSLLVPGAGYGRNTRVFSASFEVDGIEISPSAVQLGTNFDPHTRFRVGSIFEADLVPKRYDGIYCYDLLHLFMETDRRRLMKFILSHLKPGGILYLTVFSNEDDNCGKGERLEQGTYLYKPGKYAHFYSEEELRGLVPDFEVLETRDWLEAFPPEGDAPRSYRLRSLTARREQES
ncbi:class I SAM-dependent methyltransferase [Gorillibacterium timonense]|uniref:class I SAM-dependent methyltransferase n=1 Tax=Gorillibacterium timonense TaxID=1689269 RepID=UPI00071E6813|nr:class I SAM-dependent methyltransferase [Gorillibacterium timonense]